LDDFILIGSSPVLLCVSLLAGIVVALVSAARRSAEESVTGDWVAVGVAIKQRRAELGLTQAALGRRARLSKQTIGDLENAKVRDRRNPRTLEAVSVGLEWHPGYLAAVLVGRVPPRVGEPVPRSDDDIPGHISVVEHYLRQLLDRVDTIDDRLDRISASVDIATQRTCSDGGQSER
jgi:transcriptional regulator with XRE-family HTH domain